MAAALSGTPRARRPAWFVTAHSVRVDPVGDRSVLRATSLLHAKTMGTSSTACGLPCGTWTKVFDLPFPPAGGGEVCRTCSDVVARHPGPAPDITPARPEELTHG